jgi:hypothetical protein
MARKGRRRYFKAAEKVAILKRHLVEREEVSAICEDLKILLRPTYLTPVLARSIPHNRLQFRGVGSHIDEPS